MEVPEIVGMPREIDLIITEGFKEGPFPKIEVNRAKRGGNLFCGPGGGLLAVVTGREFDPSMQKFGLNNHKELADFIIKAVSMHETGEQASPRWDVESSEPALDFPTGR